MPASALPTHAASTDSCASRHPTGSRPWAIALPLLLALLLAACGGKGTPGSTQTADGTPDGALPTPTGTSGSVTGMPAAPGPGHVGPPSPEMAEEVVLDENGNPIPVVPPTLGPDGQPIDPATLPPATPAPAEPTPDEAVALIRDYYAALNAGDFPRAHAMWADGGRASGQSATQFAEGFVDATGISVEVMPPGNVEGAAGSRFVEVPVAYTVTLRDGTQRRFVGAYTLRRAVVDGATPDQRAWRIGSADVRVLDR